jgi:hypothetical protein
MGAEAYFTDERPNRNRWRIDCSGCRCTIHLFIENYPHGPNEPRTCPVCKGVLGDGEVYGPEPVPEQS